MAGDRGEYRPIYTVILDGKDFQELSAIERWVLICLKMSLGMLGITVVPGLVGALAERTGHPEKLVAKSLNRLEEMGWLERERNVAWLVRGFEFEPSMTSSNDKHVASVRKQVDALPTLAIVDRFRRRYHPWFADPPPIPSDTLDHTLSIPSRITETKTKTVTETETRLSAAELPTPDQPDPIRYTQRCTAAANRGLRENPLVQGFNELVSSNQDEPPVWRDRGVPVEVAEGAVYQRARSYRPKPTRRQPTSLGYFRQAVEDEWARAQGRALEPGVNVTSLPDPEGPEPIDEYERLARQFEASAQGAAHAH